MSADTWPKWESHKIVRATPIVRITSASDETENEILIYVNPSGTSEELFEPTEPAMKARAEVGGYAVAYEHGYASLSPRGTFEDGYTRI